jgi:hypothetical protein
MPQSKIPAGEITDLERHPVPETAEPSLPPTEQTAPATSEPLQQRGTLRVLVFATEQPDHPETSAPFVIIPEAADSFLPQHPGGLEWRYFATMRLDDQMLLADRMTIEQAFRTPGYYISDRPLHG